MVPSIRGATEADLDRLIEVHGASYPDDRDAAKRRLNFTDNALGRLADLRVATIGRRIVGHGFGFPLHAYFGGAPVSVVGIASIAVAPEARGEGIATAIVRAIETQSRKRGAAVSILHAFRHGFYARLGYAPVATNQRFVCDSRAIPKKWIAAARAMGLRAATSSDAKKLTALYDAAAKKETGWLVRNAAHWSRVLAKKRAYVVMAESGFVSFEMAQREDHDETRLLVRDFVAPSDDARRALWGFLGTQSGQAAAIEIETRADDAIAFALTDVDGGRFGTERVEHDLGGVVAGPMVRALDARAALLQRGYFADGEVDLVVDKKSMRVVARGGRAKIAKGESRGALTLDSRALASIAFGGLAVSAAARLALVSTRQSSSAHDAIARADALFRMPPFFTVDRF